MLLAIGTAAPPTKPYETFLLEALNSLRPPPSACAMGERARGAPRGYEAAGAMGGFRLPNTWPRAHAGRLRSQTTCGFRWGKGQPLAHHTFSKSMRH